MSPSDDTGTRFAITVDAIAPAVPEQVCQLLRTAVENLAAALEDAPATPLRAVQVMSQAQRHQLLHEWSGTEAAVPAVTAPELFAARVAAGPDAMAVACGDAMLTYAELDARADRMAPS